MKYSSEANDHVMSQLIGNPKEGVDEPSAPMPSTPRPSRTVPASTMPVQTPPIAPVKVAQLNERGSAQVYSPARRHHENGNEDRQDHRDYTGRDYGDRDYEKRVRRSTKTMNLIVILLVCIVAGVVYLFGTGQDHFVFQVPASGSSQPITKDRDEPRDPKPPLVPANPERTSNYAPIAAGFREESRAASPPVLFKTTVDNAIARMLQADDVFARLKVELVDLQRTEQNRLQSQRQTNAITKAIATGHLEIRGGIDPAKSATIPLVYVPPGQFTMGQTDSQRRESARASASSHYDFSVPAHAIQVRSGYFIGVFEVSMSQFLAFVEATQGQTAGATAGDSSIGSEGNKPACNVDWQTAVNFCDWLSQINGVAVRLPTEIEWEYAARGNHYIQQFESLKESNVVMGGPWPINAANLDRSWSGCVAMNSNIQEWCMDAWDENAYRNRERTIVVGAKPVFAYSGFDVNDTTMKSDRRSVRGSNFRDTAANRDPSLRRFKPASARDVTIGFRIVVPILGELIQGDQP